MPEALALAEELLEDNLLKAFSPVHFWQNILASVRVRIKNNVVTYTTAWQAVYSLIWLVLVTLSSGCFQIFYYNAFYHKDMLMYFICVFGALTENISYSFNIINRYTHRDNNINIYVMLQRVDRTMQLDKYSYYTDFQYRLGMFITIVIVVGFLCGFGAHAFALLDSPGYTVFYALGVLTIYMDGVVGAIMIYFLAIRISVFNRILKDCIQKYKINVVEKQKVKTLKNIILSMVRPNVQTSSLRLADEKWLECLQDILRCYKTITELFSLSILNLSLTVLIWTFMVIGAMVIGYRSGLFPLSATITLGMWAGSYYLQLTVSAMINDWFIMEVKKMKLLCIRLISYDYDGPYQKTASEMIRIIHYDTPIFAVYGILVFNRKLPLEIIGIIASNVLVLIQFII